MRVQGTAGSPGHSHPTCCGWKQLGKALAGGIRLWCKHCRLSCGQHEGACSPGKGLPGSGPQQVGKRLQPSRSMA